MGDGAKSPQKIESLVEPLLRWVSGQSESDETDSILNQLREAIIEDSHTVDRIQATAIELHGENTRKRRRELELQSLIRLAQGLLATTQLEESLQVLVGITRDLFSADVAHINVRLGEGEDYQTVRAIQGAMTEAFRQQRTPAGAGLTGLITESKSPYVSTNYLSDPNIKHSPSGDASIRADGIHTIAGVPLLVHDEVVGVLMISFRSHTVLADEQLGLLVSLATLSALSIDQARRTDQMTYTARQVQEESTTIKEHNYFLERANQACGDFTGLLATGGGIDELTDLVSIVFEADAAIIDANGILLCGTGSAWENPEEVPYGLDEAPTDTASRIAFKHLGSIWVHRIMFNHESLGTICIARDSLHSVEQRTLTHAAQVSGVIIKNRYLAGSPVELSRGSVQDLLDGRYPMDDEIIRSLRPAHPNTSGLVTSVVSGPQSMRQRLHLAATQTAKKHGGIAGTNDSSSLLIIPSDSLERTALELHTELRAKVETNTILGAAWCRDHAEIPETTQAAANSARSLLRMGHENGYATPNTLGTIGTLLGSNEPDAAARFIRDELGALIAYDNERGTNLVETLHAYLLNGGSLKSAASDLHVHPNTILQRLQRISVLRGAEDWRENHEKRAQLQLATTLHYAAK